MINDVVSVFNLALNAIGARSNVGSPDEASREAEVCRLWYTVVRDMILSAAPWPEATAAVNLALKASATSDASVNYIWQPGGFYTTDITAIGGTWDGVSPLPGFLYKYATPSDMINPQYLTTFDRFRLTNDANDQVVLQCNTENATLVYTKQLTTVSSFSSTFQMALVYGLAGNICSPLTGKRSLTRDLIQQANGHIISAREDAANNSNEIFQGIPDWLIARGFYDAQSNTKFVYPLGQLLAVPVHV